MLAVSLISAFIVHPIFASFPFQINFHHLSMLFFSLEISFTLGDVFGRLDLFFLSETCILDAFGWGLGCYFFPLVDLLSLSLLVPWSFCFDPFSGNWLFLVIFVFHASMRVWIHFDFFSQASRMLFSTQAFILACWVSIIRIFFFRYPHLSSFQ